MNPWIALLAITAGYLLGAVSFSRLIARIFSSPIDPQKIVVKDEVSGVEHARPVNASSMSMALGWKAGCLISALDMLKVTLPVLAFKLLFPDQLYFLLAAAAGLIGNNWPVYYRFKGGSGISAIYGGLLVIDPLAILVSTSGGLLIGLVIMRSFAVMFLLSLLLIIPWLWFRFHELAYVGYAVVVNLFYLIMFARDAKAYLRPGVRLMSEKEVMAQMPMGRGMMRMIERLGLSMNGGIAGILEKMSQQKK
jgi:acyl phosphate:glycerol-3-phosphate acyltransferase